MTRLHSTARHATSSGNLSQKDSSSLKCQATISAQVTPSQNRYLIIGTSTAGSLKSLDSSKY